MTFQEFGLQVKKAIYPGKYDDVKDELVAQEFLNQHPEYWDLISPAVRKIHDLMQRNNRPSYMFPGFVSSKTQAEDEAAISRANAAQAADLAGMDLAIQALNVGMTVTDYSQAQLEAFQTRLYAKTLTVQTSETIRLEQFRNNETVRLNDEAFQLAEREKRLEEELRILTSRNDAESKLEFTQKRFELEQKLNELRRQVRRPPVQEP